MATIFLPTKNRPNSLHAWLSYMAQYYPQSIDIVIAEGADDSYKKQYQQVITAFESKLKIEYLSYPADWHLSRRSLDVLRQINDEYIIISGDDDFPILEKLLPAEDFLQAHSDYASAMAPLVWFEIQNRKLDASLQHAADIEDNDVFERLKHYTHLYYPTAHGMSRKSNLIEKLKLYDMIIHHCFGDLMFGLHDVLKGKIKCLDYFGFFRTRIGGHSYLATNDIFLEYFTQGDYILSVRQTLAQWITRATKIDTELALSQSAEVLTIFLMRCFNMRAIPRLTPYQNAIDIKTAPKEQYEQHFQTFSDFHRLESVYQTDAILNKAKFIIDAMKSIMRSNDNEFEAHERDVF